MNYKFKSISLYSENTIELTFINLHLPMKDFENKTLKDLKDIEITLTFKEL